MLLVIQNSPFSPLNGTSEYLEEYGIVLDVRRIFDGDGLPNDLDHAGMIVLGGPQAAFSDEGFPQRQAELRLIRQALNNNVPYLGMCLGAQLLAVAAGGRGYRGHRKEVGWVTIRLFDHGEDELFGHWPESVRAMCWHQDHFDLPERAVRMAASSTYDNQIVRVGRSAWGTQFHLEVNERYVVSHVEERPVWAESVEGGAEAILAETRHALGQFKPLQAETFRRFSALIVERARAREALAAG